MKEDFVTYEMAVKLKEKGFNKFCENGYFLKSGIEYSTPNDDSVLVSSIGERIFNTECCWFEEEIEYGRDIIYAPTISQVLNWLRKEKNLHIEIVSAAYGYIYIVSDTPNKGGTDRVNSRYRGRNDGGAWDDYNECVLDAIEYVIDNLI